MNNDYFSEAVEYEILTSRWAGYVSNGWLQKKIAHYYIWKVRRHLAHHQRVKNAAQIMTAYRSRQEQMVYWKQLRERNEG